MAQIVHDLLPLSVQRPQTREAAEYNEVHGLRPKAQLIAGNFAQTSKSDRLVN